MIMRVKAHRRLHPDAVGEENIMSLYSHAEAPLSLLSSRTDSRLPWTAGHEL